ncbi:MAG: TIGR03084 family metal-binding protein [Acidimicrobiales bacterium]
MDEICDDLAAEHQALDDIVAGLDEEQWRLPTPAEGWDVADTIVHLIQADVAARIAVTEPDEFVAARSRVVDDGLGGVFGDRGDRSGQDILTWWRSERGLMLAAFRSCQPKDRIPWFGPDMSALSFATARLMETWSHGQDVADTVGATWPVTDRLRHVAHIAVSTRGWSYVNRGLTPPDEPVRVELTAPSGAVWTWGPADAGSRVSGPAVELCLVATQRRHRDDTSLSATPGAAEEWLSLAQAFAGPATMVQADRRRDG